MKQYPSLRDTVRDYISNGIYDGRLQLGDRISEQSVADQMGVSRTPAREALMQLHSEGILEYTPRKGFSLRMVDEKEKNDMYEATALLDAFAAASAQPHMTDDDITTLNEYIEKIDVAIKYRNLADYSALQHQFHEVYRRRCNNDIILRFLKTLESGLVPQTYVDNDEDRLFSLYTLINDEHRHIVELFAAGDRDELFRYLMQTHWAPSRP